MARIAVVQTRPVLGRVKDNLERVLALLESRPADLYVLPELAFSGYRFTGPKDLLPSAENAEKGPAGDALRDFCRRKKAYLVTGFAELDGGTLYNAALSIGPNGNLGVYRKLHLFGGERALFTPGDRPFPVYTLPFGRVGVMICYDWFFPEAARTLALGGAELIAHPSNLVLPHCPEAMVTRCLENRVFAATADRVGVDETFDGKTAFIGKSQIVLPDGRIEVRLGADEEAVAVAELDLSLADRKTIASGNDLFADRRPAFYKI